LGFTPGARAAFITGGSSRSAIDVGGSIGAFQKGCALGCVHQDD